MDRLNVTTSGSDSYGINPSSTENPLKRTRDQIDLTSQIEAVATKSMYQGSSEPVSLSEHHLSSATSMGGEDDSTQALLMLFSTSSQFVIDQTESTAPNHKKRTRDQDSTTSSALCGENLQPSSESSTAEPTVVGTTKKRTKKPHSTQAGRERRENIEQAIKEFEENAQNKEIKEALELSKKRARNSREANRIIQIIKFIAVALKSAQNEQRDLSIADITNLRDSLRIDGVHLTTNAFTLNYYTSIIKKPLFFIELFNELKIETVTKTIKAKERGKNLQNKEMMFMIIERLRDMDALEITTKTLNEFASQIQGKCENNDKRRKIKNFLRYIEAVLCSSSLSSSSTVTDEEVERIIKEAGFSQKPPSFANITIIINELDLLNPIYKQSFLSKCTFLKNPGLGETQRTIDISYQFSDTSSAVAIPPVMHEEEPIVAINRLHNRLYQSNATWISFSEEPRMAIVAPQTTSLEESLSFSQSVSRDPSIPVVPAQAPLANIPIVKKKRKGKFRQTGQGIIRAIISFGSNSIALAELTDEELLKKLAQDHLAHLKTGYKARNKLKVIFLAIAKGLQKNQTGDLSEEQYQEIQQEIEKGKEFPPLKDLVDYIKVARPFKDVFIALLSKPRPKAQIPQDEQLDIPLRETDKLSKLSNSKERNKEGILIAIEDFLEMDKSKINWNTVKRLRNYIDWKGKREQNRKINNLFRCINAVFKKDPTGNVSDDALEGIRKMLPSRPIEREQLKSCVKLVLEKSSAEEFMERYQLFLNPPAALAVANSSSS